MQKIIALFRGRRYTHSRMSEQAEDLNTFSCWDNFGATLMLGLVPAAMCYVFDDEHKISTLVTIGLFSLLISVVVLALSLITRWRIIGAIVNLAGAILTPVYVGIAVYAWWPEDETEMPEPATQQETAAPQPQQ